LSLKIEGKLLNHHVKIKPILIPIAIYFVWVLSAYLLEGRTNLLQNPDPTG
jgi:hypothetical protein